MIAAQVGCETSIPIVHLRSQAHLVTQKCQDIWREVKVARCHDSGTSRLGYKHTKSAIEVTSTCGGGGENSKDARD